MRHFRTLLATFVLLLAAGSALARAGVQDAVRPPDHGLRARRQAPRDGLRVLPRQRRVQGHAARLRRLPRRRARGSTRCPSPRATSSAPSAARLPHGDHVRARGALRPRRGARQLRELPQRRAGGRQAARPHPDHRALRELPQVLGLDAGLVRPRRHHRQLRLAATTASRRPARTPRTSPRPSPASPATARRRGSRRRGSTTPR